METDLLKFIGAFAFVMALMGLLSFALRKLGTRAMHATSGKRLTLSAILPIDARRRFVLVRCDDKEHLVLIGPNEQTLIKADITPAAPNTPTSVPTRESHAA